MYDYLKGKIVERKPDHVVIDVGGVGYRVDVSLSTYEKLPRSGEVKLLTYLRVSEDDHRLYGFATQAERELFLRLMAVPQLGPSKAVAILSRATPEELTRAIEEGDLTKLKSIKGIGAKIASRLILELRGKLPDEAGKGADASSSTRDACSALVRLGIDRRQAEEAVGKAVKELGSDAAIEELIRRSLKHV